MDYLIGCTILSSVISAPSMLCLQVAVVVLQMVLVVAGAKKKKKEEEAVVVHGQDRVRYRPYFKSNVKGSGEVIQFYRAIYPADYSDLSKYSQKEVEKMAALSEGPEDVPDFVELGENAYFGRSRECRETTLIDHDLARRCVRADLFLLGPRRITLYTVWNLIVYFQPILVFFVTGWVIFVALKTLIQVLLYVVRFMSNLRMSNEALLAMLNKCIGENAPGTHTEDEDIIRWHPETIEVLKRLRVKMYHNILYQKEAGLYVE